MTRTEARMVAEELYKLLRKDLIERVTEINIEANDKQLSTKEAAEYLGYKPKTIYNNISRIPHYKVGKALRFSQMALAEFIRTRPNLKIPVLTDKENIDIMGNHWR